MDRKYSNVEVEQILKIALQKRQNNDSISADNIYEIAKELNIDKSPVQSAINDFENNIDINKLREEFVKKRRKRFFEHLTTFCAVNSFLVILNLLTSHTISWSVFPLLGWGLGLFLNAMSTLVYKEEDFQKFYLNLQRKRSKKNFVELINNGVDIANDALKEYKYNKNQYKKRYW